MVVAAGTWEVGVGPSLSGAAWQGQTRAARRTACSLAAAHSWPHNSMLAEASLCVSTYPPLWPTIDSPW